VPETIFKVMGMIFRGKNPKEALTATYGLDESPEDLIGWIDENLPREYAGCDLERGFEALSRADLYLGRVRRRQDYGMWRYAGFMMVCGVNRARRGRFGGFARYSPPTYWQKLGRAKSARTLRDSIAVKVGRHCHVSKAEARASYLPLVRFLFDRDEYAARLSAELKLEEEEIAFLLDAKKASKKVGEVYRQSRELIEAHVEEEIDAFGRFAKDTGGQKQGASQEKPGISEKEVDARKRKRSKSRDGGEPITEPAGGESAANAIPDVPAIKIGADASATKPVVDEPKLGAAVVEEPGVELPSARQSITRENEKTAEGQNPKRQQPLSDQRTLFDF